MRATVVEELDDLDLRRIIGLLRRIEDGERIPRPHTVGDGQDRGKGGELFQGITTVHSRLQVR